MSGARESGASTAAIPMDISSSLVINLRRATRVLCRPLLKKPEIRFPVHDLPGNQQIIQGGPLIDLLYQRATVHILRYQEGSQIRMTGKSYSEKNRDIPVRATRRR